MKICDLVQSFTARSGGIRTYIQAKQDYLSSAGRHQHVLIVPGEHDRTHGTGGSTVHEVASPFLPGYRPYRFNHRLDRVAGLLAQEQPDVIELASPYLLPWAAFNHRRRYPCAVVGYYHADFPEAYVGAPVASVLGPGAGVLARRLATSYARTIYRRCDLTITASPIYRERLEALDIPNVDEVPLGVDLATFNTERRRTDIWPRFFPTTPDGPVLVYGGRLDREKQVEVVVDAFRRLPEHLNARLLMLGEGPLRPALTRMAAGDPRLCVRPYESDRGRLATLLASADLYVTAGPFETFGLSVLEAQACGLPVVGVAAGALPGRVPSGFGALVPVGDAAAMAAAVADQLACDPRARGLAARAWVEREFGWEQVFDRLISRYESLPRRTRPVVPGPRRLAAMGVADR